MLKDDVSKRIFQKYLRRGLDGEPCETIAESFCRVAMGIAAYDNDPHGFYIQLHGTMRRLEFVPNRPAWFGVGRAPGFTSACTFLNVEDSLRSIMGTLTDAAFIQQAGGGVGWGVSDIRPAGARVSSTGGKATGPVGFISAFNGTLKEIQQGGHQMGANNVALHCHHPDINTFIDAKMKEQSLDQFNTNVLVTDPFLERAYNDGRPEMALLAKIIDAMWTNGGIGIQFLDTANRANAIPGYGPLQGTNPCSEFWLFDGESCMPGYINMTRVIKMGGINWDRLADITRIGTRCMDNLIDANRYIPAVPKLKEMAMATRRMGVGPTGLADALILLDIKYGSLEAQALTSYVMEWILYHAMKESVRLAKERGSFPLIGKSVFSPDNFTWEPPKQIENPPGTFGRPFVPWADLMADMKRFGIRNCGHTVVAPSSFGSQTMGTEGYGIEPIFAASYDHQHGDGNEDRVGSGLAGLDAFVSALDVPWHEHVAMVAAAQPFTTESISKTVNLPFEATREEVADVVHKAWRRGLKNVTVYRSGSREEEVLTPCVECSEVNFE
ncbi:MAG: hypothetical protein GY743_23615 [Planctomycetaceae bacterium]|nr:hypothetical protein [Planctomycetaceae bacterium]